MIDPGNPFSRPYRDLIDSLEEQIRRGVLQPDQVRITFERDVNAYPLSRFAEDVIRVTGMLRSRFTTFQRNVHYRFSNNQIVWISEERPDERSRFEVEFVYRERPAGLTDFNPGSVIGTLIRAVARELTLFYDQMDQAYRRAFIDHANGAALDNVVALLGVTRTQPIKAEGFVTFFRRTAPNTPVLIPQGTRVADQQARLFDTTEPATLLAVAVEVQPISNNIVRVTNRIDELVGIWRRDDNPEEVDPQVTGDTPGLQIGEAERTITVPAGTELPAAGEVRIRYRPKSVTVPVEAVEPGPDGNVNAGTIVIMPTPPQEIQGVINEAPVEGGQSAEPDEQLRERAKHALERSGNATLNALRFAVLGVDGVEAVEVIDHHLDNAIPLGEVRVRYSGGAPAEVQQVLDETRAAGILVRPEQIVIVLISGNIYVIPEEVVPETATSTFLSAVINAIEALNIGAPLSVRRLNALVYDVTGLADVAETQLRFSKGDPNDPDEEGPITTDPYLILPTERARPDRSRLRVALLAALSARETRRVGNNHEIDLQLLDAGGAAVEFRNFSIDLEVALRASLTATPGQTERIGGFTRPITFTNTDTATLIINAADTTGFRDTDHDPQVEVLISPVAYPGLQAVTPPPTLDLSLA